LQSVREPVHLSISLATFCQHVVSASIHAELVTGRVISCLSDVAAILRGRSQVAISRAAKRGRCAPDASSKRKRHGRPTCRTARCLQRSRGYHRDRLISRVTPTQRCSPGPEKLYCQARRKVATPISIHLCGDDRDQARRHDVHNDGSVRSFHGEHTAGFRTPKLSQSGCRTGLWSHSGSPQLGRFRWRSGHHRLTAVYFLSAVPRGRRPGGGTARAGEAGPTSMPGEALCDIRRGPPSITADQSR
jgi:hypothetical protein